jgi:cyclic dehypoxanthinyl futalosine synthase
MSVAERSEIASILERTLAGERLSDAGALALLESRELIRIGRAANEIRNRLNDPGRVTFVIDRNVNYTNICTVRCEFCSFSRDPGDFRGGYLLPKPVMFKKIAETIALGGTGVLLQGGHHPDLGFDYYDDLFRSIKARYSIHLHALSPSEVLHISRRSKMTVAETIRRLHEAGLDSIPGGGAEILVDRVRREVSPRKAKADEWLSVMREAQKQGLSTTATMMYGHVETLAERVEHMRRIRELQDETHGFRAFISWTFQRDGNRLQDKVPESARPTAYDYLLTQAVSRLYFDNVPHIQASWLTQGLRIGQLALAFGADDIGSTMIEENVVASAGTRFTTTSEELVRLIKAYGKQAVQRDTYYQTVRAF